LRAAFADGASDHAVRDLRATGVFPLRGAVTFLDVPDELFARLVDQADEQEFVIDYPVEQRGDVIEQPVRSRIEAISWPISISVRISRVRRRSSS